MNVRERNPDRKEKNKQTQTQTKCADVGKIENIDLPLTEQLEVLASPTVNFVAWYK